MPIDLLVPSSGVPLLTLFFLIYVILFCFILFYFLLFYLVSFCFLLLIFFYFVSFCFVLFHMGELYRSPGTCKLALLVPSLYSSRGHMPLVLYCLRSYCSSDPYSSHSHHCTGYIVRPENVSLVSYRLHVHLMLQSLH